MLLEIKPDTPLRQYELATYTRMSSALPGLVFKFCTVDRTDIPMCCVLAYA